MTPTMKAVENMTAEELAEAFDAPMSPSQAAATAAAYANMKGARYLLPDGEIMSAKDYADALDALNKTLKKHVEKTGPFHVEGVGTIKLQDRALGWSWDCQSMAENDMPTFTRLLTHGAVTIDAKVADALEKAGQVTGFRGYGHRGNTTALIIDKER